MPPNLRASLKNVPRSTDVAGASPDNEANVRLEIACNLHTKESPNPNQLSLPLTQAASEARVAMRDQMSRVSSSLRS